MGAAPMPPACCNIGPGKNFPTPKRLQPWPWRAGRNGSSKNIPICPSRCCRWNRPATNGPSRSSLIFSPPTKPRKATPSRGAAVFEKAQCVKCHRYGNRGEGIGPDLSNVSSRFQRKEILESVIFPSQVISDQFAAKTVVTTDGKTYTGLVGPTTEGVVVLQANAEKMNVAKAEIDMVVPSKKSAMPEGLFNTLTLPEIADLFAYMAKPPAAR